VIETDILGEKTMYEHLSGKRLLLLGGVQAYCEVIEYCKEMGIYTIVTDFNPTSPAKKLADKAYDISTTDIEGLEKIIEQEKVNGIFVCYMDFMLPIARKLCDKYGFPFYASVDQIRLSQDKSFFKETCQKYSVPVPKDFTAQIMREGVENADIAFPVIVKPVDSARGQGVRICKNAQELKHAVDYALEVSPSKRILVEEYVVGVEITATYTMKRGEVSLSCMKDKLLSQESEYVTSQSDVFVMPSTHLDLYLRTANDAVVNMLKGMGARDGVVFFQGIAQKDRVVLFELGYRPSGGCDYRHLEKVNGINFMRMLVSHALSGEMDGYELSMDDPHFHGKKVVVLTIWAHAGVIGKQTGLEEVLEIANVTQANYMHDVGYEIFDDFSLMQYVFRCIIIDDGMDAIKESILKIQSLVKVEDSGGKDMLYKVKFDICRMDG